MSLEHLKKTTQNTKAARRWPLGLHHKPAWIVIGLVVLVLIIFGVMANHNHKSNTNKQSTDKLPGGQISISDSKFNPQTLSVKAGTQVTWINQSTRPHQVAADPYPKNDSIPGFDSNIVLRAGDSYTFTFTHEGTYTYHDQLHPLRLKGTVIVK
jgi:plastocyanin